jgi:transposase
MKKEKVSVLKQNVGIDVSKDDFDACIVVLTEDLECKKISHKSFQNTSSGIARFIEWALKNTVDLVTLEFTMEATGVYYENLAFSLFEHNFIVHVVLPNLAKKYVQSLGLKSKTDEIDALALGNMGIERKLHVWHPGSKNIRKLKTLSRERYRLIKQRTAFKNQLHAYKHEKYPPRTSIQRAKALIHMLDSQVEQINNELKKLAMKDEVLNNKIGKITSIPGVADITAITIVAETNGFAAIRNIKQLQSYAGYDVQIRQSGKWQGKTNISKKGNSHIRHALYFPALAIANHNDKFNLFYQRLKQKKEKPMIASTAVQRKLLGLIYTLWKNDTMFDHNYDKAFIK